MASVAAVENEANGEELLALPTLKASSKLWRSRGEIDTDSLDAVAVEGAAATAADNSVRMDERDAGAEDDEADEEGTHAPDHPNDDENVSALAAADRDSIGECLSEDEDEFTDVGAKVEHVESTVSDGRRRD